MTTFRTPARALAGAAGVLTAAAAPAAALSTTGSSAHAQTRAAAPDGGALAADGGALAAPLAQTIRAYRAARLRAARRHLRRDGLHLRLSAHGHAVVPTGAPGALRRLVRAANRIALTPYVWGGGHGSWTAAGYDCSGSVGYALHGAGLLVEPETSGALAGFGRPGSGRWVTVYANGGHAFLVVGNLRFDTSARTAGGSRWTRLQRSPTGYAARHPARM